MRGFEPLTSSLPRKRSTPELHRLVSKLSEFRLLNQRAQRTLINQGFERVTRLEPATYSLEGCRSTN